MTEDASTLSEGGLPVEENTQIRDERQGRSGRSDPSSDTGEIMMEIQQTRERMGETAEELGRRLNPHRVKETVKETIRDSAVEHVHEAAAEARDVVQAVTDRSVETARRTWSMFRDRPVVGALVAASAVLLVWRLASRGRRTRG